jgi:acyl carrier protein
VATNKEIYDKIFMEEFGVTEDMLEDLEYGFNEMGFKGWDSIGHMIMIAGLETDFKIKEIDMEDVLEFSSYKKGKEIMKKYGIEID